MADSELLHGGFPLSSRPM